MDFLHREPSLREGPPFGPDEGPGHAILGRTYLSEPGWRIGVKSGNSREFCYMKAPGQDYYHRLLDHEIFLERGPEKVCLACASRRGLLALEPRRLREGYVPMPLDMDTEPFDPV